MITRSLSPPWGSTPYWGASERCVKKGEGQTFCLGAMRVCEGTEDRLPVIRRERKRAKMMGTGPESSSVDLC